MKWRASKSSSDKQFAALTIGEVEPGKIAIFNPNAGDVLRAGVILDNYNQVIGEILKVGDKRFIDANFCREHNKHGKIEFYIVNDKYRIYANHYSSMNIAAFLGDLGYSYDIDLTVKQYLESKLVEMNRKPSGPDTSIGR